MLKKDDRRQQMVYYQAGIGTYTSPHIATPIVNKMSKIMDGAVAWNLSAHVLAGYEFLMQNYEAGDKICIFGFSRGAYTARALAGMISTVGVLPACNHQQVPFAYKMYKTKNWHQTSKFRETFSMDVPIEFLGVWDTVSSVGIIGRSLPFTMQCRTLKTFRHAISADERRAKFKPNLFRHPGDSPWQTDVREVWFAGCHCDVGGGSVKNDVDHNLARIPLRWMIRECFRTNTGILFLTKSLRDISLDPESLYPEVIVRPEPLFTPPILPAVAKKQKRALTEEEADAIDALCPIYDQLRMKPFWWMLEVMPVKRWVRTEEKKWLKEYTFMNLGRGRKLYREGSDGLFLHRTMKIRMEALDLKDGPYLPRAKFQTEPTWVD
ncbi:hypothetical protein EW026_g1303 [Hermanssonia centrifuga]|uniref:T6SS Phospholipase effector Tle1-like catalytic domain-containing protein n=1 Tax=Hermanssonia centrifuga TaxID=98765 RepID=A0A4V3XBB2_9APHY|nr:hypothetical protein EW026_g1303 [Hermanssonia centrifuga]